MEPPVTPTRALFAAVDDGLDIPSEWPTTCRAGGFGILHKETAVSATQPLLGGAPFVLLFFPHIFTHDDDGSSQAVGGRATWDKAARTEHTLPPPLPGQVGSFSGGAASSAVDTAPTDGYMPRARLVGLCTVDITWDLVSQALHISSWELPQTFVHGDGLLIPHPEPLHSASDKCLSVSHDTPEAVACLHRLSHQKSVRSNAARHSGRLLPSVLLLCPGIWRILACFSALLALPGAYGVRLDGVLTDAAADPAPEPLSWTHELSRQTMGFLLGPKSWASTCSASLQLLRSLCTCGVLDEVLLCCRSVPGDLPCISGFLQALGYSEGVDSLHIAYDTNPHALDLVLVPPTGGTWWILQDSTGMEVLRPVVRHYSSAVHFRLLTVSPDRVAQTVCPAYSVVRQPLLSERSLRPWSPDHPSCHIPPLCSRDFGCAA